jgi:hypothetical protein
VLTAAPPLARLLIARVARQRLRPLHFRSRLHPLKSASRGLPRAASPALECKNGWIVRCKENASYAAARGGVAELWSGRSSKARARAETRRRRAPPRGLFAAFQTHRCLHIVCHHPPASALRPQPPAIVHGAASRGWQTHTASARPLFRPAPTAPAPPAAAVIADGLTPSPRRPAGPQVVLPRAPSRPFSLFFLSPPLTSSGLLQAATWRRRWTPRSVGATWTGC